MRESLVDLNKLFPSICLASGSLFFGFAQRSEAQNRYATSDNGSGYVHWIDLYDADNRKIDPAAESPKPYSPEKTCGRCHEYSTISHGWHFNATDADTKHGRPGQPWIWSDDLTGTHLPLSFRGWEGTHNPDDLGLSRWEVAAKLGGFMPGGGVGSLESLLPEDEGNEISKEQIAAAKESESEKETDEWEAEDKTHITGAVPVDCMMCHRNAGSGYSPFVWSEQIEDENFAYAPTAALGIATVSGNMTRLKGDFDPKLEENQAKLPKVAYEQGRFRSDGKVFFDLVRKPKNDSCYYCHTSRDANSVGQGLRWMHDDDVHVRAGIACADCHRNGLDHHTVRGYDGELHEAGGLVASLSCQGCHVGDDVGHGSATETGDPLAASGRLGAPMPEHKGLPPIHFEKMTCTACHSGSMPSSEVPREINSIAHRLGEHIKRTGMEAPAIFGTVNLPVDYSEYLGVETAGGDDAFHAHDKVYTPHRMMWPSYWGLIRSGKVEVLNPQQVYDIVRRPLKVRKGFEEDLGDVKLSLSDRKKILGEDRARAKEEDRTPEEQEKIAAAEEEERKKQVNERMAAALEAIEEEFPDGIAVYISAGQGFVRKGEEEIEPADPELIGDASKPYQWPLAHNVRPARQSLGANGCVECHSDESLFFQAEITPVGLLPGHEVEPIKLYDLQQADMPRLTLWNQLFAGRSQFKVAGLIALALTCLVVVSAMTWNLSRFFKR